MTFPAHRDVGRHVGAGRRQSLLGLGEAAHDDHVPIERSVGDLEENSIVYTVHREHALLRFRRSGNDFGVVLHLGLSGCRDGGEDGDHNGGCEETSHVCLRVG